MIVEQAEKGGRLMANFSLDNITEHYFDIFKELGNIGAGNATTALASLLQSKVDMSRTMVFTIANFTLYIHRI